jgi:hypothetical protein
MTETRVGSRSAHGSVGRDPRRGLGDGRPAYVFDDEEWSEALLREAANVWDSGTANPRKYSEKDLNTRDLNDRRDRISLFCAVLNFRQVE